MERIARWPGYVSSLTKLLVSLIPRNLAPPLPRLTPSMIVTNPHNITIMIQPITNSLYPHNLRLSLYLGRAHTEWNNEYYSRSIHLLLHEFDAVTCQQYRQCQRPKKVPLMPPSLKLASVPSPEEAIMDAATNQSYHQRHHWWKLSLMPPPVEAAIVSVTRGSYHWCHCRSK